MEKNQIEKIVAMIERLPPEKQAEVADFVAFLSCRSESIQKSPNAPLTEEPLFGLWRSRKEMVDSVAFVKRLRQREWDRHE